MLGTRYILTSVTVGNLWLKEWSESNTEHDRNADPGKYIGIYFAFGFGSAALVMAQTLILWLLCAIEVCPCCGISQN